MLAPQGQPASRKDKAGWCSVHINVWCLLSLSLHFVGVSSVSASLLPNQHEKAVIWMVLLHAACFLLGCISSFRHSAASQGTKTVTPNQPQQRYWRRIFACLAERFAGGCSCCRANVHGVIYASVLRLVLWYTQPTYYAFFRSPSPSCSIHDHQTARRDATANRQQDPKNKLPFFIKDMDLYLDIESVCYT